MNIVLGSTSPQKMDALRIALKKLEIESVVLGLKTSSGQNEQPVGFDETYKGALMRAKSAKGNSTDYVSVGIESGLFRLSEGKRFVNMDMAIIVVLTPDGRRIVTTSSGIVFPKKLVNIAYVRGFSKTTVGSVIAEKLGGDPTDPHATLTKGKITRMDTLVDALVTALKQI